MSYIGDAGRQSDSGIFMNCEFSNTLEEGLLSIPADKPLTGIFYIFYKIILIVVLVKVLLSLTTCHI